MRRLLLAALLVTILPRTVAPAEEPCPRDTAVAATELAAGHRLFLVAHTSKGWVLMMFGTPAGDRWWVFAVNHRHEACLSSDGDHLEIVQAR